MTMPCQHPGPLKLFAAEPDDNQAVCPTAEAHGEPAEQIAAICRALSSATGWEFRFEVEAGQADTLARLVEVTPNIEGEGFGVCSVEAAQQLGSLVAKLISDKARLERALGEREAELAASVPIVVRPRAAAHLSERLAGVLQGGAQSLGCTAAAMYLLNDDTSELKLRAQWGMGAEKLAEPARPLAGALADLEALCGHAVVLDNALVMDLWNVPEPCVAAVCVPISGPASVLGTLWFYCDQARKFTDMETNLAEILAGRLAAELDREALVVQLQNKRRDTSAATGSGLTSARLET